MRVRNASHMREKDLQFIVFGGPGLGLEEPINSLAGHFVIFVRAYRFDKWHNLPIIESPGMGVKLFVPKTTSFFFFAYQSSRQ
jgi:hypothetical protein